MGVDEPTGPTPPHAKASVAGIKLGRALWEVREEIGPSRYRLCQMLGVPDNYVLRWEAGYPELGLENIVLIEDQLGVPRGEILRRAGYVDDGETVGDLIARDARLTPDQRADLIAAYDRSVEAAAQKRKPR